jgi:hypothetical protein
LIRKAFTDRRTDSAGATRHESDAPTELVPRPYLRSGFADLLDRSRRRHDDSSDLVPPDSGRFSSSESALVADFEEI